MADSRKSIYSAFLLYALLPAIVVMLAIFVWLAAYMTLNYLESKERLIGAYNEKMVGEGTQLKVEISELDIASRERASALKYHYLRNMGILVSLLVVGCFAPIVAAQHIQRLLMGNLDLLKQHLQSDCRGGSSLMPQAFEFEEFRAVLETLRRTIRERMETGQRWKQAESELVAANSNLLKRAEELKEERKVALSMMKDAEIARAKLEEVNLRMSEVLEQAKQSAQEAKIANLAKSEFLATISHEIRTPLNGVIGFIEMLDGTELSTDQMECVHNARVSGQTLLELINDVLDFSKIESGYLSLERRKFNLVRMLRDLAAQFYSQAANRAIHLEVTISDQVPRVVEGDEVRIRQVLTNLLSNAIKFTQRGEIRILVGIDGERETGQLCELEFEVRDSGIGMNKEQLKRLFQPFAQGDSSMTRRYGGTGLGLAISKRLAEAMGGHIWATSREGEGSSFYVNLKVIAAEETVAHSPPPVNENVQSAELKLPPSGNGKAELRRGLIAVAEDNKANQRVLMMMLKKIGYSADFFENGAMLIDYLKGHPCKLVLMDLQMPVMDGIEATEKIRNGEAGDAMKDAKIVALTANVLTSDRERCLQAGMDAYIGKPIKRDLLNETVHRFVGV